MAFRELQAMQVAYELLSPLDPNAQQRVMAWLSAALADDIGALTAGDDPVAPQKSITEASADVALKDSVVNIMAENATAEPDVATAEAAELIVEQVAAAESAVEPAPVPRPKRRRSLKATGRPSKAAARSAPTATPTQQAPGRRRERPSGNQFLDDLAAAGSFKALAEKYGKSIGTIGNWANQLREQGFDVPGGRQKA